MPLEVSLNPLGFDNFSGLYAHALLIDNRNCCASVDLGMKIAKSTRSDNVSSHVKRIIKLPRTA